MKKTVCELFAGVGGFRCGLNGIKTLQDAQRAERWETVWFNQWEPDKKHQWAHDCYVNHFGTVLDLNVGPEPYNPDPYWSVNDYIAWYESYGFVHSPGAIGCCCRMIYQMPPMI